MKKKIGIIGLAKSGTTALYSAIKKELPHPRRLVFEPNNAGELRYVWNQSHSNALTKMMFTSLANCEYQPGQFTHNVAIVRDPRDVLVSSILFQFNRMNLINKTDLFASLVNRFRDKENAPRDVPIVEIIDMSKQRGAEKFLSSFSSNFSDFMGFLKLGNHHVLTYDQMIEGDLDATNAYLGMNLTPPERLSGWTKRMDRKGGSGDWKNWLTKSDVEFFQPVLQPFIDEYGFETSWDNNDKPVIEPAHCSEYILNLAELRKVDPNRKSAVDIDPDVLKTAIEDRKYFAVMHRLDALSKPATKEERQEKLQLQTILGAMGYSKHARHAFLSALTQGNLRTAAASFKDAISAARHQIKGVERNS